MPRLGVNPVPWPCCSGRLLLLWHRWEQLLGSGQSRESQHFHVSALTPRKWEIFVSKVTATIEEETRGKPSFMYPDESRTQLTHSPAKGKCPNPVLQYSVLTFNFVHRSYRFSQPQANLSLWRKIPICQFPVNGQCLQPVPGAHSQSPC